MGVWDEYYLVTLEGLQAFLQARAKLDVCKGRERGKKVGIGEKELVIVNELFQVSEYIVDPNKDTCKRCPGSSVLIVTEIFPASSISPRFIKPYSLSASRRRCRRCTSVLWRRCRCTSVLRRCLAVTIRIWLQFLSILIYVGTSVS